MKTFIMKFVLDEASRTKSLINVKLELKKDSLLLNIINLPTATKNAFKKSGLTEGNKQIFQKDTVFLLKTLIEKVLIS